MHIYKLFIKTHFEAYQTYGVNVDLIVYVDLSVSDTNKRTTIFIPLYKDKY